jgi:threonine dehydratase
LLTLERVEAAREATRPHVRRTPLHRSDTLSRELGCEVYLKLELFQKTGSFKPRGAFAQLLEVVDRAGSQGVVAVSGGNFAQGAAYAARELGVRCLVLMPEGTPANYVEATRGYGAEVELTPDIATAFERADAYAEAGRVQLHPFAHEAMMAGDGGVGLEIAEDLPSATDAIVSIGGGGLISGVATALTGRLPGVRVWGVETEGADVMSRSLRENELVRITPTSRARTLGAPTTCQLALDVVRALVEDVVAVPDAEAFAGSRTLLERAKVVAELAAGCTVAAARRLRAAGRIEAGAHLVLVICGGNVDLASLCEYRADFGDGAGVADAGRDAEPTPGAGPDGR